MHYFNTSVLPTRWNLSTKKSYGSTRRNFRRRDGHSTHGSADRHRRERRSISHEKEGVDNEELARRVNIEAAKTVAKTLRLRDIGGLVMIDLIDMEDEGSRREVEVAFESIAKRDRAQLTFLPISPLE